MKTHTLYALTASLLLLASCTSYFKKKECEKVNWHEHGRNVALSGKRLNGDDYVRQCERVDAHINHTALDLGFKAGMANYCLPETVMALGRDGQRFNPDMCDGSNLTHLAQQHQAGIRIRCQPENGYRLAALGNIYDKMCPADLEAAFLKEFDRGRKVYLRTVIEQKNQQVTALDKQISDDQQQLLRESQELDRLPLAPPPPTAPKGQKAPTESPEITRLRNMHARLTDSVQTLHRKIQGARNQQTNLRREIAQMQVELGALN